MDGKHQVALEALKYIREGNVVGLGSGTTASEFIRELGKSAIKDKIIGVATSTSSDNLARELGIKTVDIDDVDWIDITVDGADEVDGDLNILKGGGGQLTREKMVWKKSRKYLVIVTAEKLVARIPDKRGIPVEIIHFGHRTTMKNLELLGLHCKLREGFVTDNGNLICDCTVHDPVDLLSLEGKIKTITGVVESGLFLGGKKTVLVAGESGVREIGV
ncbi:MAG: ribose-5-phosphate isomerase RpiA [Thermoplasmatales archaeon]